MSNHLEQALWLMKCEDAIGLTNIALAKMEEAAAAIEAATEALKSAGIAQRPRSLAFFAYSRLRGIAQRLDQQLRAAKKAREILASEQSDNK